MVIMKTSQNHIDWLKARHNTLGGSDIASVVGMNPWRTNVQLWREKMGLVEPDDISESPAVKYGTQAEEYIRKLFELDYPRYRVLYKPNNIWLNSEIPFGHASLDGWLYDKNDRLGVLEIKTSTIKSPTQKMKWQGQIPDNYFCQVLWYMAITEAEFAVLQARLRWDRDDVWSIDQTYFFERSYYEDDIHYLIQKGSEFYDYMVRGEQPPLVLPEV